MLPEIVWATTQEVCLSFSENLLSFYNRCLHYGEKKSQVWGKSHVSALVLVVLDQAKFETHLEKLVGATCLRRLLMWLLSFIMLEFQLTLCKLLALVQLIFLTCISII